MANFTLNVPFTLDEHQLQVVCDCMNENNEFRNPNWEMITVAEIIAKPKLAEYMIRQVLIHLRDYWGDVGLELVADEEGLFDLVDQYR